MKTLVAVGALVLCLCGSAAQAPAASKGLRATTTVKRWSSPQRYPASTTVWAWVFSRGHSLEQQAHTGCAANYTDGRLAVRIRVCGPHSPVQVRYVSFGGRVDFRVRYRTRQHR